MRHLYPQVIGREGYRSKLRIASDGSRSGDKSFARGGLYTLLSNPIYVDEIRHKGARHSGQHQQIVERVPFGTRFRNFYLHILYETLRSLANRHPVR